MLNIARILEYEIDPTTQLFLQRPEEFNPLQVRSENRGGFRWLMKYSLTADHYDAGSMVTRQPGSPTQQKDIIGHAAYMRDVNNFEARVYELMAVVINPRYSDQGLKANLVHSMTQYLKECFSANFVWGQTKSQKTLEYYADLGFAHIGTFPSIHASGAQRHIFGKNL